METITTITMIPRSNTSQRAQFVRSSQKYISESTVLCEVMSET